MKKESEIIEIIQNATIIYTDKVKESYEAIQITEKGISIGRIIDDEFLRFGFIPDYNIKQVKNGFKKQVKIKKI